MSHKRSPRSSNDILADSHKLIFHPGRVADWLHEKPIAPIYLEVAPSGGCNHRCIFCAFDYLSYHPVFLHTGHFDRFIREAAKKGLRSIMFGGEGEPLLHPHFSKLVRSASIAGLDIGVTTNGVLIPERIGGPVLPKLKFLRISLDAATPGTYATIHRSDDFQRVLTGLEAIVAERNQTKSPCTIGIQFLLLDQNCRELIRAAKLARDLGADYFMVKPYSQHPNSTHCLLTKIPKTPLSKLERDVEALETEKFRVYFREKAVRKASEGKPYKHCLGLPFAAYLSATGDLYACNTFLGDHRFLYGNIGRQGFSEIWFGENRKRILDRMENRWNLAHCRLNCRLDEINRYLDRLKNPPEHVNFI